MRGTAGRGLLIRMLGYGGTAVLITIAIGILVVTFTGDGRGLPAGGSTRAGGPVPGAASTGPALPVPPGPATTAPGGSGLPGNGGGTVPGPVPNGPGTGGTAGETAGGTSGTPSRQPCATRTATYTRSGNDLTVQVIFAGTGYVSAFVELTGRGTITKSGSGKGRHVFAFADVPADITRGVGLTTISKIGLATCEVKAAG